MRTFRYGNLTVNAYDENVYKQECNVLAVSSTSATQTNVNLCCPNRADIIASYTFDEHGRAIIDVSDFMRANPDYTHLYVTSGSDFINVTHNIVGLISPESLIVPKNVAGARIQFPTMIYASVGAAAIAYEFSDKNYADYRLGNKAGHPIQPSYDGVYGIQAAANTIAVYSRAEHVVKTHHIGNFYSYEGQEGSGYKWKNDLPHSPLYIYTANRDPLSGDDAFYNAELTQKAPSGINGEDWFELAHATTVKPLDCEHTYAAVRWVSATGLTRVHTFEVRDLTQTADETISLETPDGTYDQLRSRRDSFKLYLGGLNSYDYWYYSDVINSSTVEVSLDGENWRRVEVTTKSVTIPNANSGKLNNLDINVNWREYDAVAM